MFENVVDLLVKKATEDPSGGRKAATIFALLMSTLTTHVIPFGAIVSVDVSFSRVIVCANAIAKSKQEKV
jgi:hypothetical protein